MNIVLTQSELVEAVLLYLKHRTGHSVDSMSSICVSQSGNESQAESLHQDDQPVIWCDQVVFNVDKSKT